MFLSEELMSTDSLPRWSLSKTSLFSKKPFLPISFLFHHGTWEFSLPTMGTWKVLTCYLNNWWIELDHPDSNEELGWIRDLGVGREILKMWRMPTKVILPCQFALSLEGHLLHVILWSYTGPYQQRLLLDEWPPGKVSMHSAWYVCVGWIYKWNHKSDSFSHWENLKGWRGCMPERDRPGHGMWSLS